MLLAWLPEAATPPLPSPTLTARQRSRTGIRGEDVIGNRWTDKIVIARGLPVAMRFARQREPSPKQSRFYNYEIASPRFHGTTHASRGYPGSLARNDGL